MSALPTYVVERSPLAQRVAQRLEVAIREGRLRPGERLSSERVLSEQFGVSRPILREALQLLQERSLVITRRGRGSFVRDVATELGEAPPETWLRQHRSLVTEFYQARLLVEPACAARAARRRGEAELVELKQILHAAERLMPDGHVTVFTGLDIDFHTCIARIAGNRLVQQMLAVIINPETDLRRVLHRVPGHPVIAQARHGRIVAAIERRDPAAARVAMGDALQGTLHDVDRLLKGGETPDILPTPGISV